MTSELFDVDVVNLCCIVFVYRPTNLQKSKLLVSRLRCINYIVTFRHMICKI